MPLSPSSLNGYDFNSNAEKILFEAAIESGHFNTNERFFFHSLSMVKTGDRKQKGEIDFVYLDKDCVLFFEVKGGEVKFDTSLNQWYVLGGTERGDPFKQAYKALFYTRDNLIPNYFNSKSVSCRLVFGIGVLFPESLKPDEFRKSTEGLMEFDPELIFDYSDYVKKSLINYIEKIKRYWSSHQQYLNRPGISIKEMNVISKYFRQDLHFKLPVSDILKKANSEVDRLTGLQMYTLDNLQCNPNKGGIIMGGPGTGKTLLALELLKRKISEDKKVLLICFNKNLAYFLAQRCIDFINNNLFDVFHLHALYVNPAFRNNSSISITDTNEFWSQLMPLDFARNINTKYIGYYDYVIIDEGQDLLNEYHMDAIGKMLKGGLASGNWSVFMDKDFQNIYNAEAEFYLQYLKDEYPCNVMLLQVNCRNTISTIKRASEQTGFPAMPCLRTDHKWKSEIRFYDSENDFGEKTIEVIRNLEESGVERKHITVLCFNEEQIDALCEEYPKLFFKSAFEAEGCINVSTIHSFKGLENQFIIVSGPIEYDPNNKQQMSLIYIANTRAIQQSVFLINKKYRQIIVDRICN
jgi:Cdc6-like AAA superfamily ATPase